MYKPATTMIVCVCVCVTVVVSAGPCPPRSHAPTVPPEIPSTELPVYVYRCVYTSEHGYVCTHL